MPKNANREAAPWICEFCYMRAYTNLLPASWDLVFQSAVCSDCAKRVARDGGYHIVTGGTYAEVPDPRALTPADVVERPRKDAYAE